MDDETELGDEEDDDGDDDEKWVDVRILKERSRRGWHSLACLTQRVRAGPFKTAVGFTVASQERSLRFSQHSISNIYFWQVLNVYSIAENNASSHARSFALWTVRPAHHEQRSRAAVATCRLIYFACQPGLPGFGCVDARRLELLQHAELPRRFIVCMLSAVCLYWQFLFCVRHEQR